MRIVVDLPDPLGPKNPSHLTCGDFQVQSAQRLDGAETLCQSADFQGQIRRQR